MPIHAPPCIPEKVSEFLEGLPVRTTYVKIEMVEAACPFAFQCSCHRDALFGFAPTLGSDHLLAQSCMEMVAHALVEFARSCGETQPPLIISGEKLLHAAYNIDIRLNLFLDPADLLVAEGEFVVLKDGLTPGGKWTTSAARRSSSRTYLLWDQNDLGRHPK